MSARSVAGQKPTTGRKPVSHIPTRQEEQELRAAFHDFERRHGRKIRPASKPTFGAQTEPQGRRKRLSPGSWQDNYILALIRTGDRESAATMSHVSYGTARNCIARNKMFRQRCEAAESAHANRKLHQVAKGQISRWELSPRTARALVASIEAKSLTNR